MATESGLALYDESVVIDALNCLPELSEDYIQTLLEAGVTAVDATLPTQDPFPPTFLQATESIQILERIIKKNSDKAAIALTARDIENCKKEGKVAIIAGSQDGSIIEANVDNVDSLFRLGYRVIQITYNRRNLIGDGCCERVDAGLSKFGIAVIERMNELGMVIDLSHVGPKTTMEAIEFSKAPVCFTHANAMALCDHFRNKSDEALKAVAERGGVIGLNVISSYSRTRPGVEPDIEDYYNMMDYVVDLVGADHVGIGTDISPSWTPEEIEKFFEAYPELAGTDGHLPGLDSVIYFKDLTQGLLDRGYSQDNVRKILGGNWLRLFRTVWGA